MRHQPVLLAEVVDIMLKAPSGLFVDATLGSGGHTEGLLRSRADISVLGLDRDGEAVVRCEELLAEFVGERAEFRQARSDHLEKLLEAREISGISGFLMDLGVSSEQLDTAERGFSFRGELSDSALDMRMDRSQSFSAADVVNSYEERDLADVLRKYGDERFSGAIAKAIVKHRPLSSTRQLAEVVEGAVPKSTRRGAGHPARRTFQAIRIEVNEELGVLARTLPQVIAGLKPGGRGVLISYHSGEDRIVKDFLREAETGGCQCPSRLPCVCGAVPKIKLLHRGVRKPNQDEIAKNPRASAARMRSFEKLDVKGAV